MREQEELKLKKQKEAEMEREEELRGIAVDIRENILGDVIKKAADIREGQLEVERENLRQSRLRRDLFDEAIKGADEFEKRREKKRFDELAEQAKIAAIGLRELKAMREEEFTQREREAAVEQMDMSDSRGIQQPFPSPVVQQEFRVGYNNNVQMDEGGIAQGSSVLTDEFRKDDLDEMISDETRQQTKLQYHNDDLDKMMSSAIDDIDELVDPQPVSPRKRGRANEQPNQQKQVKTSIVQTPTKRSFAQYVTESFFALPGVLIPEQDIDSTEKKTL